MRGKYALICIMMLVLVPFLAVSCNAQTYVEDYSPVFYFEGEEACYPVSASYHLQNSYFYDSDGQLISSSPTASSISTYSDSSVYDFYYLDNTLGTINDDKIINNYQSNENSLGYTVYYREYYDYGSSSTVIQYWMFYAFNKGHLNQHEGDWEMVEVVVPDSGDKWVAYSQHYSGQRATWDLVETEGNHIKVYVARGSHANFLRSYSGKLGVANDYVGSNGKILQPGDYTLMNAEDEDWLDFAGRWGELGGDVVESTAKSVLGQAGPRGPKYRLDGEMWGDPVGWGSGLMLADSNMFLLEWFIYNIVTIFIVISVLLFALTAFLIFRRHKKYGLGPRFVSILYIDGFNIKSIGNIICIVGIILIILGLIYPWYHISYDTSALDVSEEFQTSGMTELMKIDGIGGVQVIIPGQNGFSPLGTVSIPFSFMLGVSLIFLIFTTIGIAHSKKLGGKYIWRGSRFLVPVILILIAIMALAMVIPSDVVDSGDASGSITNILSSVSRSPLGNQQTFNIDVGDGVYASLGMSWGLGSGGWYLLIGAILLILAGVLEKIANTQFFATKVPLPGQTPTIASGMEPPTPAQRPHVRQAPVTPLPVQRPAKTPPPTKASKKGKPKVTFCDECGAKLEENATFCVKCGKKFAK